jgi:hypothetical protein
MQIDGQIDENIRITTQFAKQFPRASLRRDTNGFSQMKSKIDSPTSETDSVTTGLLLLAEQILGHARRLENIGIWRDAKRRNSNAESEGEPRSVTKLIRILQASRIAENDSDQEFMIMCQMGEHFAETIFQNDPESDALRVKMRAVEMREELPESYEFDPDHPETPADWKELNGRWHDRFRDLEKLYDHRFTSWLRRHGETVMADLYVNDRNAFDRRREAGRLLVFGPHPENDPEQGDTGVTEVVGGDE